MNRFYGKLTNGELYYRGIELRRRDCPTFLKKFQEGLMSIIFDAKDGGEVVKRVAEADAFVRSTYDRVLNGDIDPAELSVSKRVRKEVEAYRSLLPHVVAAKHLVRRGKKLEEHASVDFVYTNAGHANPMRRVLPSTMMDDRSGYYDREKYGRLVLDVADTILKPLDGERCRALTLDPFMP